MALYKTEGLVLRTRNLGEADRIITLYTAERGKVDGVARGSRRPRSRLMGVTQLFTYGNYLMFSGRSLDTVSQGEIVDSFSALREDLTKMAYSSYLAELVDVIVMPEEPGEDLFHLLLDSFKALGGDGDDELILRRFELQLMALLGYRPQLTVCIRCGGRSGSDQRFSIKEGGLLCSACGGVDSAAAPISDAIVKWMQQLLDIPVDRLRVLKPSANDRNALEHLGRAYVDYRLSRPLKSIAFMASLKNLA